MGGICNYAGFMHADPGQARLITVDIPRFWQAFDAAQETNDPQAVFERLYLEPGTAGLQDFRQLRADQVAELGASVLAHWTFYTSIREASLNVHRHPSFAQRLRSIYRAFKNLVSTATFPDTTLLIGALGTGGCPAPSGNLIGLEFFLTQPETSKHELNAWERANLMTLDDLPFMVAHEYVHLLQGVTEDDLNAQPPLLWVTLGEGAADFVASLATGEAPRGPHYQYGPAHEAALWTRFQQEMHGTDITGWLYQGDKSLDRPADLGYFIGHQIVQVYYEQAGDKQQAVADVEDVRDAPAFLQASGYAP